MQENLRGAASGGGQFLVLQVVGRHAQVDILLAKDV